MVMIQSAGKGSPIAWANFLGEPRMALVGYGLLKHLSNPSGPQGHSYLYLTAIRPTTTLNSLQLEDTKTSFFLNYLVTQPFDRSVFKSLKSHWNAELDNFIRMTGIAVGHAEFLKEFSQAWGKSNDAK